jgi:outer membrane protein insertion porin family
MRLFYTIIFVFVFLPIANTVYAQTTDTSGNNVAIDPALMEIFKAKYPKEYTIASISVEGTKAFDETLIASISGLAVGDKVTLPGGDAFSKAIQKLWKQNLVGDVQIYITKIEGTALHILLSVYERPRLAELYFDGVKKNDKDELGTKTGLQLDRVLTENVKQSAVDLIKKFYTDKGFGNVTVSYEEFVSSKLNNGVGLRFTVVRGKKVKVSNINISGNELIADETLKKQFKGTKEKGRFTLYPSKNISVYGDSVDTYTFKEYISDAGFLYPSKTKLLLAPYVKIKPLVNAKFNLDKYQEDKERLLDYYYAQGYRDAIIEADTTFDDGTGNRNIDIKVKEGRQYYFGNIAWRGNTKYNDSLLNFILGIKKGQIYNQELLNKRIGKQLSMEGGDISSLYMDDGYLFFRVDAIETAVYNDTLDFEIRLAEGLQAVYDKITITGNDRTKDYVIRRELRTLPGEKFSRQDIIRTQRELGQLGFLNAEKINPNVVPNADKGTVDIEWQVEERSANQLELSAGFGGGIGLTGTLGFSLNNFSLKNALKRSTYHPFQLPEGDGQKLSIRAQSNGRAFRSYNFSFTEPWLGGTKRNSFTVAYSNTRFANTTDSFGLFCRECGKNSYVNTNNFTISLGKQLKWPDDFFNLIYSLTVQTYKLKNYPRLFPGLENGTSTNISAKIALIRNSAGPNPIFPTSGSNFALSGQFTLPYSLLGITSGSDNQYRLPEFHKWRFDGEWFVPIGRPRGPEKNKQFILKAAAKFGFIGRYNPSLEISPFERFQVGDAGLSNNFALLGYDIIAHRGYPIYSSSNPKVNPENSNPSQYFTIFNKYTMEMRYPFSTSPTSTIYGLAFFEAANGWYDFKTYNPFKLRRSAGVGMRFFLPMFGLLGFDYGVGLDRYNQQSGIKGAAKFTFMLGQEPQ